jgi:hypothetical protein
MGTARFQRRRKTSVSSSRTVPLSQLAAVDPDESTAEASADWHYWVALGYCF